MKNAELRELQMFRTETKASQSKLTLFFFFLEKKRKSDSHAGKEVESPKTSPNLPTSVVSKYRW